MTSSTPVPIDPEGNLPTTSFGSGTGQSNIPRLEINHELGQWKYLGTAIKNPVIVFFGLQSMRRFYSAPYDVDPKAPLACGSWDARNAYGFGGRAMTGKPRERQCYTCPRSSYEGNKNNLKEWCAPTPLVFGMLVHAESDVWTPFFWDASGRAATVATKAYGPAYDASKGFMKKQGDGTIKQMHPIYSRGFSATLYKPNDGKKGYMVSLTETQIEATDIEFIGAFFAHSGKRMWDDEVARRDEKIRAVGGSAPSPVTPTRPGGPVPPEHFDEAQVPF